MPRCPRVPQARGARSSPLPVPHAEPAKSVANKGDTNIQHRVLPEWFLDSQRRLSGWLILSGRMPTGGYKRPQVATQLAGLAWQPAAHVSRLLLPTDSHGLGVGRRFLGLVGFPAGRARRCCLLKAPPSAHRRFVEEASGRNDSRAADYTPVYPRVCSARRGV